ncbi:MAG: SDR family oxidoreductase, partial [Proteobacteria bacterium]|nr:SDR family oxidoreductase [Pseudomonadota bacterium]
RLFCFGLGYSATALADALLAEGWTAAGTARTEEACAALRARGIDAHRYAPDHPLADTAAALAGATHLLNSVPPDADGDPVLRDCGATIAARADLAWVGYLSTTGVYGDRGGGWVDEDSARDPSGERGARRVAAEDAWLGLWRESNLPIHLFRLAGIYGPGRNALRTVRDGRARRLIKPGQVFSRIHLADIVATLRASIARPAPGRAYNLCDDEAAPPQDVIAYACTLLGIAPPPEEAFDADRLSPMGRSFYADNKRVRNDRIKAELGVVLAYPDYRQGLQALFDSKSSAS